MGGRPEPETIDVEPTREPFRTGHGYRVGARIAAEDTGRARLAGVLAVGIILAGLAPAAIGSLLPPTQPLPAVPVPGRSAATPLPAIAVLRPPGPTRPLPVYAGGLRWLDPVTGRTSGDIYSAPRGRLFVDSDGRGLCVCLEIPWSQDRLVARVTLRRFTSSGEELARAPLYQLESTALRGFGDPVQIEAAIAPDGRYLWIARAVRAAESWELGVDRVDLVSLEVDASLELDPIPLPSPTGADQILGPTSVGWITHQRSAVQVRLRVSPDGSRLSVLLSVVADPRLGPRLAARLPASQRERLVLSSDLVAGTIPEVALPVRDATMDSCDGELSGWATNRLFITICSPSDRDGARPYVRIEGLPDGTRDVAVGPPGGAQDSMWLLDARRGLVYRWSSLAQVLSRLQVATVSLSTLTIEPDGAGTGDLATWPDAQDGGSGTGSADGSGRGSTDRSVWAWLAGSDVLGQPARMVGSADGTVLFALGFERASDESADALPDEGVASTGIWVLDAARPAVLARWAPAALYSEIGFAPGWERLLTVARPGADAAGSPTDWPTSMRFHDPRSGDVVEVLGNIVESRGFDPAVITPNAPGGIAGF